LKNINKLNELDSFIELIPDLVFFKNLKGQYTHFNQLFLDFIEKTRDEVLYKTDFDLFIKKNALEFRAKDKEILELGTKKEFEESFLHKDGLISYFSTSKEVLYQNNEKIGLFCIAKNITHKKEYEFIYNDTKFALEYITIENNLSNILNQIVSLAEKRVPKTRCSILILDKSKKHLFKGAAPSLPSFYNDAINGVEIGEKIGSCGSAAYKRERVIVEDINSHENWKDYLELTKKANLHACWSEPIFSSNNEILGTFAIYNAKPKSPSDFELKLINSYAHLVSVALEKINTQELFLEKEKEFLIQETNLKKNKLLTKNILDTIPDMVWVKDLEGKFLACNSEFGKLLGGKEENIIGKTDYDFVSKELSDFFRENDKNAMQANKPILNEEWVKYKRTNKKVLLETTKKAMRDEEGNVIGVLGIGHNITQRAKKEKELKKLNKLANSLMKEQANLLSLFDKGDTVLFKWRNDMDWSVEHVSSSVTKLLGYEKDDFLSKELNYSESIHKDDLKRVFEEVTYAVKNNLDYFRHEPYRIITKNGEEKFVLDNTVTQKNSKGKITHFIGYLTDISEQKQQQEIIFQQAKMVSLAKMLGNIAHQWRQPLSIITTVSTGAKLEKELGILSDESFYKDMDTINENAQYLSKIIDDFKNFITKDKKAIDFNLSKNIDSFLTILSSTLEKENIAVIKDLDDSIIVHNFDNDLKRALINITNNSIDIFKNQNIKNRYIFISTKKEKDNIVITIKDTAGGINNKIIDTVFEPYTTTKHKSLGIGLGLNIAYNSIVNIMKGLISVKNISFDYNNKFFNGAEFTIIIKSKN